MTDATATGSHTAIASGAFRLDEQRALEKLRNFQLASPHDYILELVKVAHLLDAETMDVTIDPEGVVVSMDGDPPAKEYIEQLYAMAFGAGKTPGERALRHMAMGVNSGLGAGFGDALIEVGGPQQAAYVVRDDEVVSVDEPPKEISGVRIRLSRRLHRSVLARFRRVFGREGGEVERLEEKARYSRVSIAVNGEAVETGFELPGNPPEAVRYRVEDEVGFVVAELSAQHLSTRLVQHGVLLEAGSRRLSLAPLGGRALVDSGRLDTDLSQQSVVADRQLELLRRRVDGAYCRSLAEVLAAAGAEEVAENRRKLARGVVGFFSEPENVEGIEQFANRLADSVAGLPLFRPAVRSDGGDEHLSIEDARFERADRVFIQYSTKRFAADVVREMDQAVIWADSELCSPMSTSVAYRRTLGSFVDRTVDVTDRLDEIKERKRRRRRWNDPEEWSEPNREWRLNRALLLNASGEMVTRKVSTASEGEYSVYVRRYDAASGELVRTHVFYVKNEVLLDRRTFWSIFGPFRIGIFGQFVPNEQYDGLGVSPGLKRAHTLALRAVVDLIEDGEWNLKRFRALFGDFQDKLNRAFQWEWSDWPREFEDTPLGFAPALAERREPSPDRCRIRQRLDRLGDLARKPLVEKLGHKSSTETEDRVHYSLRELRDLICEDSGFEKVVLSRAFPEAHSTVNSADRVLYVGGRWPERKLLAKFLSCDVCRTSPILIETMRSGERPPETASDEEPDDGERQSDDQGGIDDQIQATSEEETSSLDNSTPENPEETELLSRLRASRSEAATREAPPAETAVDAEPRQSPDVGNFARLCERLEADLSGHLSAEETDRFDDIKWIEAADSTTAAVVVLGDGDTVALNCDHPVIAEALRSASDPATRGCAALVVHATMVRFDVEHGRDDRTTGGRLEGRRQLLTSLSQAMNSDGKGLTFGR